MECFDYLDVFSLMDESDDFELVDEDNEEEIREKIYWNMVLFMLKIRECNRLS